MSAAIVKLGDVVETKTGTRNPAASPTDPFTYVDVAAVDNGTKFIAGARRMLGAEAPSRARKLICKDDVLVSTVRPNLNAVAVVPEAIDGQVASTGFCVLRAKAGVLPQYIFFYVRSRRFVDNLCKLVAGAMYPAVTDAQVLDQTLPLPELDEQLRIVDMLSRAEGILRLRREAQQKAADLIPAIFIAMFGDPAMNPLGLPIRRVAEIVARFDSGKNLQAGDAADSALRILKVSAVTSGMYVEAECKPTPNGYVPPPNHFVRTGDLLFSRANTVELVGATAIVETTNGKTLLPDKLWRVVWRSDVDAAYMHALFQTPAVRRELSKLASGTSDSMRNISQAKLFELSLPIADIGNQRKFGDLSRSARSVIAQQAEALSKATATFDALLSRAFG